MENKSTGIKIRTTGASNRSSTSSNQSIAHSDTPVHHPVAPRGNPGKHAIRPECAYDNKPGAHGIPGGNGAKNFQPSRARGEIVVKHPNPKHDPAMCKC